MRKSILITLFLFLWGVAIVWAQPNENAATESTSEKRRNFANTAGQENSIESDQAVQEEELTDEEITEILNQEGIPTTKPAGLESEISSTYTLGVEDVIEINVLRHSEVSGQYVINAEGNIQYEFIGDLQVSGLTKQEVEDKITQVLSEYVISPEVTVKILGYNSKVVYVVGEVARPGKIYMRGDTITVREALVQAGLPLLSAKMVKSVVITPAEDGNANRRKVDVNKLLYKGDLRENLVMEPGDTLYIPATLMAKAMRVIQPVAAPIGTASGTARTVTTGF